MEALTDRQAGIALSVASGMSNLEIAAFYNLSLQTVKNHIESIMDKTGAQDRNNIAIWWHKYAIGEHQPVYRKGEFSRKSAASKRYAAVKTAVTKKEWDNLLLSTGNKCLSCGATDNLTKDHIVPLSKGGEPGIKNIQPLCRACNSKKGDKEIDYRDKNTKNSAAIVTTL